MSKWETGKASPDLYLLPKLAEYFGVSIDSLFADVWDTQELSKEAAEQLKVNNYGWTELARSNWRGTLLPDYGPYTPTEEQLIFSVYGLGWTADPDKTIKLIGEYLKPGGRLVFSWDNPLLQCVDAVDGRYVLSRSYVEERVIDMEKKGFGLCLQNWKLSTYLNCLSSHGFLIERVVEESAYDPAEADIFREGKYYSAGLARLINNAFIIKARKR